MTSIACEAACGERRECTQPLFEFVCLVAGSHGRVFSIFALETLCPMHQRLGAMPVWDSESANKLGPFDGAPGFLKAPQHLPLTQEKQAQAVRRRRNDGAPSSDIMVQCAALRAPSKEEKIWLGACRAWGTPSLPAHAPFAPPNTLPASRFLFLSLIARTRGGVSLGMAGLQGVLVLSRGSRQHRLPRPCQHPHHRRVAPLLRHRVPPQQGGWKPPAWGCIPEG